LQWSLTTGNASRAKLARQADTVALVGSRVHVSGFHGFSNDCERRKQKKMMVQQRLEGKDSMVVLYLARLEVPNIAVIFNNTGVQYRETYAFKKQIAEAWNLNLIETKPTKTLWQVAKERGLQDGTKKGHNACCYYLKDKPNQLTMKEHGFSHAFTGLTVLESRMRMFTACQKGQSYYAKRYGFWKIHPVMFWTPQEVWDFSNRVQIPVNPAYEKYKLERLGCVPCTSHKFWRRQLAKTNPKMYRFIQENFFHQRLLEVEN